MPISVRLDSITESRIKRLAHQTRQTKSQVVRGAIALYDQQNNANQKKRVTAYDRLAHLIGVAEGGDRRLSENTGEKFLALLRTTHRARRSR